MKEWGELRKSNILKNFTNKWLVKKYWELLFDIHYFKVDSQSWDAQFSYLLFKNRLLSIIPSKNLIENIGYNSDLSVHCKGAAPPHIQKAKRKNLKFPLYYPKNYKTSSKWDTLVEKVNYNINYLTLSKLYLQFLLGKSQKFKFLYNFLIKIYRKTKSPSNKVNRHNLSKKQQRDANTINQEKIN